MLFRKPVSQNEKKFRLYRALQDLARGKFSTITNASREWDIDEDLLVQNFKEQNFLKSEMTLEYETKRRSRSSRPRKLRKPMLRTLEPTTGTLALFRR